MMQKNIFPFETPRRKEWEKVVEAEKNGLPKTAVKLLEPIIASAMDEKAYAEAVKAIAMKIAFEEDDEEGGKEKILRLKAEIEKAPTEEMKAVMTALLANWYWVYFENNRENFLERTQTESSPGEDFTTWDLPRILSEIGKQFDSALFYDKVLKSVKVSDYNALLQSGEAPDELRPTMYDFIAFNALDFYCAGEQGAVRDEDDFELDAPKPLLAGEDGFDLSVDCPAMAPADKFMKWMLQGDEGSLTLKAVKLFQKLLLFHKDDDDKAAFLDADLARLRFGYNKMPADDRNAPYKVALKRFVDANSKDKISARAQAAWAKVLVAEGELVEAHKLAEQGAKLFPNSVGGNMCFNIIQEIEAKSVEITAERVWNDPLPPIQIEYRNVARVYFRAVRYEWSASLGQKINSRGYINQQQLGEILSESPELEWMEELPSTPDYKERTEELAAPTGLKPGFYLIVSSYDPGFETDNNQISYAIMAVSSLAIIVRQKKSFIEGFVLDAKSGEPVQGAEVTPWYFPYGKKHYCDNLQKTESNEDGFFVFQPEERDNCLVHVWHKDQEIVSDAGRDSRYSGWKDTALRTIFFTDRSLYRPGQTIHFKGICVISDEDSSSYKTLPGSSLDVILKGANDEEIARCHVTTNDYGSFSGTFTAPRGHLAGKMTLTTKDGPAGRMSFNVEEYKRPKFKVEIFPPEDTPKLGTGVVVSGKAIAYTGSAIGGAKVKWRVERKARIPRWCWWICSDSNDKGQAIAHGIATTGDDGSFSVKFTAKPDLSVSESNEPVFDFIVHTDVTDSSGETRSGERTLHLSYTAMQATLSVQEWLTIEKPVALKVETKTLDGDGIAAVGVVRIHELEEPKKVQRAQFNRSSLPESWDLGGLLHELAFQTDGKGECGLSVHLKAGIYRAMLETRDRFDKKVTACATLHVLDPDAKRLNVKIPNLLSVSNLSVEPGETFMALWGTGYVKGQAFVEIECAGKMLKRYWTDAERTQQVIEQKIGEEMRGGFTLRVSYVRENRAYLETRVIDVPWKNKELSIVWEHFRSKLEPGQKETWTAVISGADARMAVAEMVATLYDASLDAFRPHQWISNFNLFRCECILCRSSFENQAQFFRQTTEGWNVKKKDTAFRYRSFWVDLFCHLHTRFLCCCESLTVDNENFEIREDTAGFSPMSGKVSSTTLNLDKVVARRNLNETAFFLPHLTSGQDGVVRIEFTMPEALTEWKFMGFAHDQNLRSGFLMDNAITSKELMVEPNPPRFIREGDIIEFTVKVSNQGETAQSGNVRLNLSDAMSMKPVDTELGNGKPEQRFEIPAKGSKSFSWQLNVPDGMGFLTYKAIGATDKLSDGEEGVIPVLSKRILLTESLPLPIRSWQTRDFEFKKLLESGKSNTLRNQSLTIQMTSQPIWYAVMALPYLMEYQHECSEQTFSRLYANLLASHIAKSDPKIRRVFDLWKNTTSLESPLEKNQDLKSLMIEETPWLHQSVGESQAMKNIGILFDDKRLDDEICRLLSKLIEMQDDDGAWPWFPGGLPNEYITLYITTGFGRLRQLGVSIDTACAVNSLDRLDTWIDTIYRRILKHEEKKDEEFSSTIALYLYGRSFFLEDNPIEDEAREAVNYFLGQARTQWLGLSRQSQAHLAIALKRFGDNNTATAIMRSIEERSVKNEEMGMFWRDTELYWCWFNAPIETQVVMIEAFSEVMADIKSVEECKVWLLKQKQTQSWNTTKATADAIYALLLRGTNLLSSDALVEVSLGAVPLKPGKVETGTGYYEQKFGSDDIKPEMGRITVRKTDDGVSWGAVHWQYLEDMTKVTPHEGTPLKLKKRLFIKDTSKKGQVLKAVSEPVTVGDELVVRLELRVDRDMEYVHLKDQRGSGTEPLNVLSRYKFQDGLAYYERTKDSTSHFFIDYLPKGTYVFEYSTRIQLKGRYQTGVAEIQCMYAPEFNSHTDSFELVVQ